MQLFSRVGTALAIFPCSLFCSGALAGDESVLSVRELVRRAAGPERNANFGAFLAQHGKECTVSSSEFGGVHSGAGRTGDVWSVRCSQGSSWVVFVGNDKQSTSWFLPCDAAAKLSNFTCFEKPPSALLLK